MKKFLHFAVLALATLFTAAFAEKPVITVTLTYGEAWGEKAILYDLTTTGAEDFSDFDDDDAIQIIITKGDFVDSAIVYPNFYPMMAGFGANVCIFKNETFEDGTYQVSYKPVTVIYGDEDYDKADDDDDDDDYVDDTQYLPNDDFTIDEENSTKTLTIENQTAVAVNELSGVNIYPNPSNGNFSVSLPENARIAVFGLNGAMIYARDAKAGVNEFNLKSGVYFMRISAGGRQTAKRVIVR